MPPRRQGRRLASGLVVAFVVWAASSGAALAHNGSTPSSSAYFESSGSMPTGVSVVDPVASIWTRASDGARFGEWHIRVSGGSCTDDSTKGLARYWRAVDAEGVAYGSWNYGGRHTWTSATCTNLKSTAVEENASLGSHPGYELRFVQEVSSGGVFDTTYSGSEPLIATARTTSAGVPPNTPTNLRVTSVSPPGRTLTWDMVAALALHPQGGGWSRSEAITMVAVARAESSFRTKAVSYTGCCHGLWQINTQVHPYSVSDMRDPYKNVVAAKSIWNKQGLSAWEAYTNGSYEAFVSDATAAVDRQIGNGNQAWASIATAPVDDDGSVSWAWDHAGGSGVSYESEHSALTDSGWGGAATSAGKFRTVSGIAAGASRYLRVRACNGVGCSAWTSPAVGATVDAKDPSSGIPPANQGGGLTGGDASDPDKGESCGLNVFCWIKAALRWAFVPGESTSNAWASFGDNLKTRPPFSVVYDAGGLLVDVVDQLLFRFDAMAGPTCIGDTLDIDVLEDPSVCVQGPMMELAAAHPLIVGAIRQGLLIMLWLSTFAVLWRILKGAFVKQSEPSGGEVERPNADDVKDG
jgi:hypothetical protein